MIDVSSFVAAFNLYGASDGSLPPTAVMNALGGLLWNMYYQDALRNAQSTYHWGGDESDVESAFKRSFARDLGWTDAQFEEFWNDPHFDFTAEEAQRFDRTYDDFYRFIDSMRRGGG